VCFIFANLTGRDPESERERGRERLPGENMQGNKNGATRRRLERRKSGARGGGSPAKQRNSWARRGASKSEGAPRQGPNDAWGYHQIRKAKGEKQEHGLNVKRSSRRVGEERECPAG